MATDSSTLRITLHSHSRRVRVVIAGTLIANTTRAIELRERAYPLWQYLPRDDVRMDLLTPSETLTHCPLSAMLCTSRLGRAKTWLGVINSRWREWKRLR